MIVGLSSREIAWQGLFAPAPHESRGERQRISVNSSSRHSACISFSHSGMARCIGTLLQLVRDIASALRIDAGRQVR